MEDKAPMIDIVKSRDRNSGFLNRIRNRPAIKTTGNKIGVALITSYPPRECGIATFSIDLANAMNERYGDSLKFLTYALQNDREVHSYADNSIKPFNTDRNVDFVRSAVEINGNTDIDEVLIQHEFGLFANNEEGFLGFLDMLDKPIIMTFHTVLPRPDSLHLKKVCDIAGYCSSIIVMTETSSDILVRDYEIRPEKISIISHGTHLIASKDPIILKDKYGLSGKTVLSTFGLLGPGKSIETTLRALPSIVAEYPECVFLILGRTHPGLVAYHGEDYREFLQNIVDDLGISHNVRFVNKFIPLNELLEYLQLSDIYLFTSKDPNQAVSGTFAYALSCGCPVISTPIPHAREVLRNGSGRLMDFDDSVQLAKIAIELISDKDKRETMRLNGLAHSQYTSWENTALQMGALLHRFTDMSSKLQYALPPIKLEHIKRMTDGNGIFQFSKGDVPDPGSGYTVDDNARALVALCDYFEMTRDETVISDIGTYVNFIKCCQRPDGLFYNYVDENLIFTGQNDQVNLEDSNGRAFWALGRFIAIGPFLPEDSDDMVYKVRELFDDILPLLSGFHSPRAMAFIVKGVYIALPYHKNSLATAMVQVFAERLQNMYRDHADIEWQWFEDRMTYGNAVLPEAMLMAGEITGQQSFKVVAKTTMGFLLHHTLTENGINVISNSGWKKKGERYRQGFTGGEQPIDVTYTILALEIFERLLPNDGYAGYIPRSFDWFLGNNGLGQIIYNPCTGGCHDGLESNNVNLNQGAESTVSYLMARMAIERFNLRSGTR